MIHEDFIQSCFDRLKASYDTLCVLDGDKDSINCARQEAIRMVRVLTVLREYINECDSDYHEERTILPMSRYVGKCTIMILIVLLTKVLLTSLIFCCERFLFLGYIYRISKFCFLCISLIPIFSICSFKFIFFFEGTGILLYMKGTRDLRINSFLVFSYRTGTSYLVARLFWMYFLFFK